MINKLHILTIEGTYLRFTKTKQNEHTENMQNVLMCQNVLSNKYFGGKSKHRV